MRRKMVPNEVFHLTSWHEWGKTRVRFALGICVWQAFAQWRLSKQSFNLIWFATWLIRNMLWWVPENEFKVQISRGWDDGTFKQRIESKRFQAKLLGCWRIFGAKTYVCRFLHSFQNVCLRWMQTKTILEMYNNVLIWDIMRFCCSKRN